MATHEVDVVVVGLGPGGEYAAQKLAEAGLDVVGIDRDLVGGECPFYGCIPSKMMIRAADALGEARRVDELAGSAEVSPDWSAVATRIDKQATNHWQDDSHVERLEEAGVRIVRGDGVLDGPGTVRVGEDRYVGARGVVLNVGTSPATLPIDGLAETPYWTNREIVKVTELPASLAVIGGGPIGCELAQAFARFGSAVTVLEVADRLLPPEEPESGELLGRVFRDEGIRVETGITIERVEHDGGFTITTDRGEIEADQLLVAAGRRLNLHGLGLDTVGLDPEARSVPTDERMRAGERLWAVGDITGHGQFTHVSMYQGDIAVRDILGQDGHGAEYHAVSRVTFTDPEVGSVGMSEQQARDAGIDVRVGHADLAASSRGWIHQLGADGLIKLVADADRGVLVGASSVGPSGGEVLGMLALAVHAEVPLDRIASMHFAYPTFHRAVDVAVASIVAP
ncbi:dihydrolipoyl dehydrogenase family protein [Nocardioides euryhalodurans]|uniref:NAD(P)/FAD-dependent oxidoreductase n=1 Tax=Nocardioides euryhalodurans TaxID=2518370 RepID=A0A4P7GI01_9ACTN|nr:NAD(P)/FAD-dependent oxidoreductase [Nocardioides euryhalodurans]QBR91361.1 NAD(P)/FAD-dependent oxidoreductase [Nocardioides euryhalodurans]